MPMELDGSPPGQLAKSDLIKIAKSFGLGLVGVLLTYLLEFVAGTDFGSWTPVVVAGVTVLVNALRIWLLNTEQYVKPVLVLFFALLPSVAGAGPLDATFRVSVREGNGTAYGTGTAVTERLVITNAHVIGRQAGVYATVSNALGSHQGQVISCDSGVDLAMIYVPAGGLQSVPVAETDPRQGDRVTIYGFGRSGVIRGGSGVVQPIRSIRQPGCPLIETSIGIEEGDSGSGLINAAGELCAVNWGKDGSTSASCATPVSCLLAMATRYETQYCQGGQCIIPRRGVGVGVGIGAGIGVQVRPLAPVAPPARPLVPVTPPPVAKCECDNAALVAQIDALRKLVMAQAAVPGPPGPPGPAGPAGKDAVAVTPSTESSAHLVIVADKTSPDWPRLNGLIGDAQKHYHALRVSDLPPFDVGVIPQAVMYRGGIPVRVWKGRQAVEQVLSELRRETFSGA